MLNHLDYLSMVFANEYLYLVHEKDKHSEKNKEIIQIYRSVRKTDHVFSETNKDRQISDG